MQDFDKMILLLLGRPPRPGNSIFLCFLKHSPVILTGLCFKNLRSKRKCLPASGSSRVGCTLCYALFAAFIACAFGLKYYTRFYLFEDEIIR